MFAEVRRMFAARTVRQHQGAGVTFHNMKT
jgi:hypothetical protein